MVFFPLIKNFDGYKGWTSIHNYPPNNWEVKKIITKYVYVVWSDGKYWKFLKLDSIEPFETKTFFYEDIKNLLKSDSIPWLTISSSENLSLTKELKLENNLETSWPMWRSTIGLSDNISSVSYQGEIIPFRPNGTLLSFIPFYQSESSLKNFLVLFNLETQPKLRFANIEFFSSKAMTKLHSAEIRNNDCNIIDITQLCNDVDDLLFCVSKDISGVPLILTTSQNNTLSSFEHTHPPAAFSILGNRFSVQSKLKKIWFEKTN